MKLPTILLLLLAVAATCLAAKKKPNVVYVMSDELAYYEPGVLFNKNELRGMKGLKDYLLSNRQDQFARALTNKMAAYALGRPMAFGDRSQLDRITADLRKQGDGLADLVFLIVKSDLFQLD